MAFVSWSALLSSRVCSVTSISFVEGKARRADTLGSCVPRDSAAGAFSPDRVADQGKDHWDRLRRLSHSRQT